MSTKPEYLVDLIFNKFKNYKARKIFLEKENLKKMHLAVTEELILPQPGEIKTLMNKVDQLLKLIESK